MSQGKNSGFHDTDTATFNVTRNWFFPLVISQRQKIRLNYIKLQKHVKQFVVCSLWIVLSNLICNCLCGRLWDFKHPEENGILSHISVTNLNLCPWIPRAGVWISKTTALFMSGLGPFAYAFICCYYYLLNRWPLKRGFWPLCHTWNFFIYEVGLKIKNDDTT